VDLRGITGWTDTLAWWASNHDPAQDPPDQFANITKYEQFNVTSNLHAGMWYQWYGHNERSPVAVFWVVPHERTVTAPAPTPLPTQQAAVTTREQPAPIADLLLARGDDLVYNTDGNCQVWLIGPSLEVMGNRTDNAVFIRPVTTAPGTYSMLLQYPDANGVYEVFPDDGMTVNSVWKGVDGFWYAPLEASVLKSRLMAMFTDTAHFHGRVVEKKIIVEDSRVDVSSLDETGTGFAVVKGITNLAAGDIITLVWDADRNVVADDRARYTSTTKAVGDDPGAFRVFQAILNISLWTQAAGYHHITISTPDGHETTVEFYVQEAFAPFETPAVTIRYINNSPFIPTPAPVIVEKPVTVTVVQTVTVPVTPAYEVVLQAQNEAAQTQRKAFEGSILSWVFGSVFVIVGGFITYRGGRYLKDVVRRARKE
jgi:hypothetical protein